jgi:AcrR family transcriptional regulator
VSIRHPFDDLGGYRAPGAALRPSTLALVVSNRYSDFVTPGTVVDSSVRDRLIAAAAEVFAERGYEGTRVQEVVRRAGLSTGAIYTNFRDKADLLLAAVGTAPVDSLFATMGRAGDTAEGLRRAGHLLPVANRRHRPLLFEAMVAARRDPEVAALLRTRLLEFRGAVADLVTAGQAEGTVADDVDAEATAEFCQALGMGFLLMEAVGLPHAGEHSWRDLIDRLVAAIEPANPADPAEPGNPADPAEPASRAHLADPAGTAGAAGGSDTREPTDLWRTYPDETAVASDQPGGSHGDQ